MSKSSNSAEQPLKHQWVDGKKRTKSWERWQKSLVYDRTENLFQARRESEIEKARYLACDLPTHQNTVCVFLSSDESEAWVGSSSRNGRRNPDDDEVFIGMLDLQKLPMKDKFSRLFGNLKVLYVDKAVD